MVIIFASEKLMKREKLMINNQSQVSASFEVECRSRANDKQPITRILRYYGVLEDITQLDFMSLKKVISRVEWYKLIEVGEEKTILLHDNGFHMINTSRFEATS